MKVGANGNHAQDYWLSDAEIERLHVLQEDIENAILGRQSRTYSWGDLRLLLINLRLLSYIIGRADAEREKSILDVVYEDIYPEEAENAAGSVTDGQTVG